MGRSGSGVATVTGDFSRWQWPSACPLAVEDAIHAHQRPKIERYEQHTFGSA